jgi:hypothetical protein
VKFVYNVQSWLLCPAVLGEKQVAVFMVRCRSIFVAGYLMDVDGGYSHSCSTLNFSASYSLSR